MPLIRRGRNINWSTAAEILGLVRLKRKCLINIYFMDSQKLKNIF